MTIVDDILDLLRRKRRLKLTASDIAQSLYWEDWACQQRVKAGCLTLYEQQRILREGRGSRADPYVYSIAPCERLS